MPVILRKGPYRFRFFSNENHEPPHIHVRRGRLEAKFWLHPAVILNENGGFAAHEINRIAKIVSANQSFLLEKWHDHHDQ